MSILSIFKVAVLSLLPLIGSFSYGQQAAPFETVQKLFSAMSAFDYQQMNDLVSEDFQLLEAGEVWSIEELVAAIKPAENVFKRQNYFSVIKIVSSNDIVWISYWNKAVMKNAERERQLAWLESAIVVKQQNSWKIDLLHSTPVELDTIPKDVELVEYIE